MSKTFDSVKATFDFVAKSGNSVERNFVVSTKSKQIEHVQFVSTLSKRRNFVTKNGSNVEATFDFVERIVRLVAFDKCCFDIVAGVDGA